MTIALAQTDYERLLEFRSGIRRFLRWSEDRAAAAGLTSAQHQLLLAIRGHAGSEPPAIGDVADHLLLRHHSAVELIDRAVTAGLVARLRDTADHRIVRLKLTALGARRIESLAASHLEELSRLSTRFRLLWRGLGEIS